MGRMGGSVVWVGLQHVTGGDNHAPASPDGTGGHKSTVLCQGKFLGRTTEVGDTSNDQTPLFVDSLTYVSLVHLYTEYILIHPFIKKNNPSFVFRLTA